MITPSNRVDVVVATLSFIFVYFYLIKRRSTLNILRGPPVPSYLLGLEHDLCTRNVEEGLLQWSKEYGTAYRFQGCLGENILVISDPRAIHRVLQELLQDYPEAGDVRRLFDIVFGRGVIWVKGEDHKRHRKILSPAFSINHMRQFLPLFQTHVNHLSVKWNNVFQSETQTIDIIPWFHKLTLDIIGESAFNYHFDALDSKPNELTEALHDIEKLTLDPTPTLTLALALLRNIPDSVASWQTKHFPMHAEKMAKRYLEISNKKAKEVLMEAGVGLDAHIGKDDPVPVGRDILSILVRANREEDPRKRLTEEEMLAQMSTLIQAGHHTTGYSIAWIIYELAAHPEDQAKVYDEIKRLREKNSGELTSSDYDSMNHLTLVIKESLRLHPVVPTLERESLKNDILPLDFPVISKEGVAVNAVSVAKGQRIKVDISSYNRLESVWGEDANSWNPTRFETLTDSEAKTSTQTQVGLFANILTFSGGQKGCIGWRFAIMEIQVLITGLIERYEFSITPDVEIEAGYVGFSAVLAVPHVKGKYREGPRLPLKVTQRGVE